jgi:hypothetical protein
MLSCPLLKHTIRFVSQHYYRFRVLRLNKNGDIILYSLKKVLCPRFYLLDAVLGNEAGEMRERPIVGPLRIIGEAAGGKLPAFQVVLQAFAAGPFS